MLHKNINTLKRSSSLLLEKETLEAKDLELIKQDLV